MPRSACSPRRCWTEREPLRADAADFVANSQILTFLPGERTKTFTVQVNGDKTVEPDETFLVELSNLQAAGRDVLFANAGSAIDAVGTITNDDSATLTIADVSQAEGDAGTSNMQFTVTLSNAVQGGTTVTYTTANGTATAGADYVGVSGTLTFAGNAGETQTFDVAINGDLIVEPDKTFTVGLSGISAANVTAGPAATGTILDDDVDLSIAPVLAVRTEGNFGETAFTFTVSRIGDLSGPTTVDYAVAGSGANPAEASDFGGVLPAGQVAFVAGQATQTLTVLVQSDLVVELNETFAVTLSNPSGNAQINQASAIGLITNDDTATLSINDVTQTEGNSGTTDFVFTVSLSQPIEEIVKVNVATQAVTASAGEFSTGTTLLTFDPAVNDPNADGDNNPLTQQVVVHVTGDTTIEQDETFRVRLENVTFASVHNPPQILPGKIEGVGTILNDDAATVHIQQDASGARVRRFGGFCRGTVERGPEQPAGRVGLHHRHGRLPFLPFPVRRGRATSVLLRRCSHSRRTILTRMGTATPARKPSTSPSSPTAFWRTMRRSSCESRTCSLTVRPIRRGCSSVR